jgi:hypothetical protein
MENTEKRDKFIEKSRLIHGDKYDYSKVAFVDRFTKVEIICPVHGSYWQSEDSHRRHGCRKCGNEKTIKKNQEKRTTKEEFIERMKARYGDMYDYSKVNYIDYKTKVIITCLKLSHGDFNKEPQYLLSRGGCLKCSKEKKDIDQSMTTEEFIKKAMSLHGDKYNYSKTIYKNAVTKLVVSCNLHGDFIALPYEFLRTTRKAIGCPECNPFKRKSTKQFIEKAMVIHGNKYDYSQAEYISSEKSINIICKIHGLFYQRASTHLSGFGCSQCGIISKTLKSRKTKEQIIGQANAIYGDKYDYSQVNYITAEIPVIITCKEHGNFKKTPHEFLRSSTRGCNRCKTCPICITSRTEGKICESCNERYHKTKEMQTVRFLEENIPDYELIHNRSVGKACTDTNTHRFPDILYPCLRCDVIVEVDENKHRGASYKCDRQRMYEIAGSLFRPCIFIRYNPDSKNSDLNILLERVKYHLNMANIDKNNNLIYQENQDIDNIDDFDIEDNEITNFKKEYINNYKFLENDDDDITEPVKQEDIDRMWTHYGLKVEYLFY